MTRVGVFPAANVRNWEISVAVHSFPPFLGCLAIDQFFLVWRRNATTLIIAAVTDRLSTLDGWTGMKKPRLAGL